MSRKARRKDHRELAKLVAKLRKQGKPVPPEALAYLEGAQGGSGGSTGNATNETSDTTALAIQPSIAEQLCNPPYVVFILPSPCNRAWVIGLGNGTLLFYAATAEIPSSEHNESDSDAPSSKKDAAVVSDMFCKPFLKLQPYMVSVTCATTVQMAKTPLLVVGWNQGYMVGWQWSSILRHLPTPLYVPPKNAVTESGDISDAPFRPALVPYFEYRLGVKGPNALLSCSTNDCPHGILAVGGVSPDVRVYSCRLLREKHIKSLVAA